MDICTGNTAKTFKLIGSVLSIIKIIIPILLIVMGSIDLIKCIVAGKDSEMQKSKSMFIKRTIVAIIVFFIPTIVGFLLSLIDQRKSSCLTCVLDTSTCNISSNTSDKNKKCTVDDENCISDVIYIEGD